MSQDVIPESGLGPQNGRWRQWVERSITGLQSGRGSLKNDTANSFKATNSSLQLLTKQIETLSGQNDVLRDMVDNLLSSGITTTNITASGTVTASGNVDVGGSVFSPYGRATPVVTSYASAYFNSDGRLGITPSSVQFKQDFQPAHTDNLVDAILGVALLRFRYKVAVKELGDKAPDELGAIAEYLENTPLREYVYRNVEGEVMGVNYERLTIPLIAVVQNLDARLKALEARRT